MLELGRVLGVGELPHRAARRLLEETGGNPLYCQAVLEEAAAGGLDQAAPALQVPRSLARVVQARVGTLGPAATELVTAVAVLGHQCELAAAAMLAGLDDPMPALGRPWRPGSWPSTHTEPRTELGLPISWYGGPSTTASARPGGAGCTCRRRSCWIGGGRWSTGWRRRLARMTGCAGELEAAGREARRLGRPAQAAAWMAQAAAVSADLSVADRRVLDALETLIFAGEVAERRCRRPRGGRQPSARRSQLLGTLDFLAGRTAVGEARLLQAWQDHDREQEALVGTAAAYWLSVLCLISSRIPEAIRWGERAARTGTRPCGRALGLVAIALFLDGRAPEGLARLAFLPRGPGRGAAGGHRHAGRAGSGQVAGR